MNGKFKFLTGALAAAVLMAFAAPIHAAPISGTLNMAGSVSTLDAAGGNVVGTDTATYLDFSMIPSGSGPGGQFATIGAATGSFSGIGPFTIGSITDFSFAPFVGPISAFWSVAGFQFDLESVSIISQDSVGLTLLGAGTVSGNAFDATPGVFSFSTQGGGGVNVAFSATSFVPVPGMLALFGASLVGLGLISRRRRIEA